MSSVKRVSRDRYSESLRLDDFEPKHLGYLLDRIQKRTRRTIHELAEEGEFNRDRYAPLTPGYFRLLSLMPAGGARVTDLARLSGMTKQALGQFVRVLEDEGYVVTTTNPEDRRVRIVARTALGDEVVEVTNELWAKLEARWRRKLGAAKWREFRAVLVELATGWDPEETSPEP